jgi:hypothetical protein
MIKCKNGVSWVFELDKDYDWKSSENPISLPYTLECYDTNQILRLIIYKDGTLLVKSTYAWNGCTPKFCFFDILIGTPDGVVHKKSRKPKAYFASMVHDALYQFIPDFPEEVGKIVTRRVADACFLEILKRDEFILRRIYWLAVRIFGGLAMKGRKQITRKTEGEFSKSQEEVHERG